MRLGYKCADADADVGFLAQDAFADGQDGFGQVGDGLDIFEGLGGVADHEVHLDRGPAALVDFLGGLQQVARGDGFVDYIAQAVGGGFGRKREAGAAAALFQ